MARPLTDPAVRDHLVIPIEAQLAFVDGSELVGGLERAVVVGRCLDSEPEAQSSKLRAHLSIGTRTALPYSVQEPS